MKSNHTQKTLEGIVEELHNRCDLALRNVREQDAGYIDNIKVRIEKALQEAEKIGMEKGIEYWEDAIRMAEMNEEGTILERKVMDKWISSAKSVLLGNDLSELQSK